MMQALGFWGGHYSNLFVANPNRGDAAGDVFDSIENLYGSDYADTLYGDDASNVISGAGGDDTMYGRAGDDILNGGAGENKLWGGAGADGFVISEDATVLGNTIYDFSAAQGDYLDISDLLEGYNSGDDVNDFINITHIFSNMYFVNVDVDGSGTNNNSAAYGLIYSSSNLTNEDALVDNGTLIL